MGLELEEQVGPADVGGVQDDGAPVGRDVAPRPAQRARIGLDGVHLRIGAARGDGQRERAGAGAQVDDQRRRHVGDRPQAPLQQQLGLRAGGEHPRPDGDGDRPEHRGAEQVLQGLAGGPAHDQLPQRLDHGRVDERVHHQLPTLHADDVCGEDLGVDPRRRDPGGGEHPLGLGDGQAQRLAAHPGLPLISDLRPAPLPGRRSWQ